MPAHRCWLPVSQDSTAEVGQHTASMGPLTTRHSILHMGHTVLQPTEPLLQLLKNTLHFYYTDRNVVQKSAIHFTQQCLHRISPQQHSCSNQKAQGSDRNSSTDSENRGLIPHHNSCLPADVILSRCGKFNLSLCLTHTNWSAIKFLPGWCIVMLKLKGLRWSQILGDYVWQTVIFAPAVIYCGQHLTRGQPAHGSGSTTLNLCKQRTSHQTALESSNINIQTAQ